MGWLIQILFGRESPPKPVDDEQLKVALESLVKGASALDQASKDDPEIIQFAGEVRDIAFRLGGRRALIPKAKGDTLGHR